MPTTKVFLTGASGFLGGHLLRELRAAACEVKALSRQAESDAAKAIRELDYVETPLAALLSDTLSWMRQEGMIGR
jgi:dihydroflavonol-4-reductase